MLYETIRKCNRRWSGRKSPKRISVVRLQWAIVKGLVCLAIKDGLTKSQEESNLIDAFSDALGPQNIWA